MKNNILTALLFIGLLAGCSEDILEYPNPSSYNEETFFKSTAQLRQGMVATYATLLHPGMHARDWYFMFDLMGSDAMNNTFALGNDAAYYNFSYNSAHPTITDLWKSLYRMRTRATIVIDKAETFVPANVEEEDTVAIIRGEALFMKAFAYHRLVQIWGAVPYADTWEEIKNPDNLNRPRTPVEEIYAYIQEDLTTAIALLPDAWDEANRGRATQWAAIALLGKNYLTQGKYAEALAEFKKIEDSGKYSLWSGPDGYSRQFSAENADSPETIFDVRHNWWGWDQGNAYYMFGGQETWGGRAAHTGRAMEYGFNDWWNTLTASGAVSRFTYPLNGNSYVDPRASLTFYSDPALGGDADWAGGAYDFRAKRTSWKKYNRYESLVNEEIPSSDINTQLIRYADVLLMIAECHIFMDNYAAAMPYINQVRERVGATPYAADPTSFDQAFDILKRERRLEFTGEQIRWFDLKRWELASKKASGYSMIAEINDDRALDNVNNPVPMQQKFIWFPIPNVEVQNNPLLDNSLYFPDWN